MEIELKLLVARADLKRVLDTEAVKRRSRGRSRTTEVVSRYYDTAAFDLWSKGLALRLRQSDGRWMQELKGRGSSVAGLHRREEYEWPIASGHVDPALFDTTPYASIFSRRRVREGLQQVFSTRFRRTVRRLTCADGAQAELCADLGEIRAGAQRRPICEVEVELKPGGGSPLLLFGFARELLQEVPFRLGAFSKAERGYALARGDAQGPRKAGAVMLRPEMNRAEMFRAIAGGCLAQIHANEEGFLQSKDPEYLHQFRVGFRRLRIALAIPEDAEWRAALGPLREELRWLFSMLGPVRNWDVFLSEMLPPLARQLGSETGLAAFRARCLRLQRRQLVLAREAVRSARYMALLLAIGELLAGRAPAEALDQPARTLAFAGGVIERRDRILRRHGEALAEAGAEACHRARIAAKKLRYCMEFFASLYPQKKVRRYLEALADLQEVLGAVNDAVVAAALIEQAGAGGRVDARVIGLARGWVAASEAAARDRLARVWDGFTRHKLFWH
jgi:triphosphatase